MSDRTPLRVGLLGHGAIGRPVADALRRGAVPGARLSAVLTRSGGVAPAVATPEELAATSDLVVEAAGQDALRQAAAAILAGGSRLLVTSTGALADAGLRAQLAEAPPGRVSLTCGAIGGIDVLRAICQAGPGVRVRLTSSKSPRSLIQPWMDRDLVQRLTELSSGTQSVFHGSAAEAVARFPANANVAATLALAAEDWDAVDVEIVARAGQRGTEHRVELDAATGSYLFVFRNRVLEENPRSSQLVIHALLRAIDDRVGGRGLVFA